MAKLYLLMGIFLQGWALVLLTTDVAPIVKLVAFIFAQWAASMALAPVLLDLLPVAKISRRRGAIVYLFALNLAMPVAGLVCLLTGYYLARKFPAIHKGNPITFVEEPVFTLHRAKEGSGFRGGQVRARLMSPGTPTNQKMGALVSIQDTPARVTKDILRSLLADSGDDIRLLAYGILDSKEKAITQRILALQARVGETRNRERREIHGQLAELYWELIYQNLVQGDMRAFSAAQVRHHAAQARKNADDGGLWFLLARLELLLGCTDAAEEALSKARAKNFPGERLLPYLAELRFLQRRFQDVRTTLLRMASAGVPSLDPSLRYWLGVVKKPVDADFADFALLMAILKKQPGDGRAPALPTIGDTPGAEE